MKWLISTLVILLAAVLVALLVLRDPGYVQIQYGNWSIESSLSLMILATLAAFAALYYSIRIVRALVRAPRVAAEWRRERRARKARKAYNLGQLKLLQGDWKAAERTLIKHARFGEQPALYYLAAARAAERQGAVERRDQYLKLAHDVMPDADVAIGIEQAELYIEHKQWEQALATLNRLRERDPRNTEVLRLLVKVGTELGDWKQLEELLPLLHKHKVLPEQELEQLTRKVYVERLDAEARTGDHVTLRRYWESLPRKLRKDPVLLFAYARNLLALGAGAEAEPLLYDALRRNWNTELAYLYGLAEGADPAKQLARAEKFLKDHRDDPVLLLTLGRLSLRNQLWGKAQSYLEASLGLADWPETYRLLAQVLERKGDQNGALGYYRRGLTRFADANLGLPVHATISLPPPSREIASAS